MSESPADQGKSEIPETMQAVICHGPENYQLEEVPVPRPGPGEALITGRGHRHLCQRPEVLSRCGKVLGRRESTSLGRDRGHSRPRVRREQLCSWTMSPPSAGASRSAIGLSLSRSCPAGSAVTA